ncbi:hypothetical protein EJ04DRAFT_440675 [Polyplosphaeria fusca]|uniref:Uncharacterized protein n=1 Tax=Polyplosphaeria fusca TaxID=682080 RepID=A0A9P4V1S8_9PLEO|nr:hypothetical protein EJ04DRAFT_440675 [Polyplosphaeria fusca]
MRLLSLILPALAAVPALAQNPPAAPSLTYLYTLNATLADGIPIGKGPKGDRVAIPITGGTFSGPKLNGKVLNLGADWGVTDSKGTFSADTRYNLQTDDGANIFIQTNGPGQADGKLHLRMVFETGSEKYYWLNNIVAVGVLKAGKGYVVIEGWMMNSPAAA